MKGGCSRADLNIIRRAVNEGAEPQQIYLMVNVFPEIIDKFIELYSKDKTAKAPVVAPGGAKPGMPR